MIRQQEKWFEERETSIQEGIKTRTSTDCGSKHVETVSFKTASGSLMLFEGLPFQK